MYHERGLWLLGQMSASSLEEIVCRKYAIECEPRPWFQNCEPPGGRPSHHEFLTIQPPTWLGLGLGLGLRLGLELALGSGLGLEFGSGLEFG